MTERRQPPRRTPSGVQATGRPLRLAEPRRRLRVAMVLLAFVFSLYAGRLVQLQLLDGDSYAAAATADREQVIDLPATRGAILDASGNPLASTVDAYDVTADPTQIAQRHADPAAIAASIGAVVGDKPDSPAVATMRAQLSDTATSYQLLVKQVSPQTWAAIKKLSLIGIYDQADAKRVYAPNGLAANVVGYVNGSGVGAAGLEEEYDSQLSGKPGRMSYQAADGVEIPTAGVNEQAPVPGTSIETTIDSDLQWTAQQQIANEVKQAGAASGTVVVENPHNGQIVALATYPSYDPTHITQADVPNLVNRAFSEVYEPGSIAKIMTMSAGIQEGFIYPSERFVVPPYIHRADRDFHDDTAHGTEDLTLTGILAYSSNIGTIMAADQFGPDRDKILYHYFTAFGLGQPTGIGFPGESAGILAPSSQWNASQRYTVVFGQGLAITAVQSAEVFSTIANGGVRVNPTLVKGFVAPNGTFTPAPAPQRTNVVSAQTAREVSDMMESVVSAQGTAPEAEIPGYRVAGKTGTANKFDARCGGYCGYTASFAGFVPADNPQLVVSVVLQDPVNGHFGGLLGGPVFKQVASFGLQTLHIPPTNTSRPTEPIQW